MFLFIKTDRKLKWKYTSMNLENYSVSVVVAHNMITSGPKKEKLNRNCEILTKF